MSSFLSDLPTQTPQAGSNVLPDVASLLSSHGRLLLRGFDFTPQRFLDLVERIAPRRLLYGNSWSADPSRPLLELVQPGNDAIALHCELDYSPVRPDLAAFYCTVPATSGGETMLALGCDIYAELPRPVRALLAGRSFIYRNRLPFWQWKSIRLTGPDESLDAALNNAPIDELRITSDGALSSVHRLPTLDRCAHCGRPTLNQSGFAHTNFDLTKTYGSDRLYSVTLDGDVPIPIELVCAWNAAVARCSAPIAWRSGDVLLLDNWTVLHGRRKFEGGRRRIYASFGYRAVTSQ